MYVMLLYLLLNMNIILWRSIQSSLASPLGHLCLELVKQNTTWTYLEDCSWSLISLSLSVCSAVVTSVHIWSWWLTHESDLNSLASFSSGWVCICDYKWMFAKCKMYLGAYFKRSFFWGWKDRNAMAYVIIDLKNAMIYEHRTFTPSNCLWSVVD